MRLGEKVYGFLVVIFVSRSDGGMDGITLYFLMYKRVPTTTATSVFMCATPGSQY